MSRLITAVLAAALLVALVVAPSASARTTICEKAYGARMIVVKKHGKRAPGRNICRYGIALEKNVFREATTVEKAKYLRQLRNLYRAPKYPTLVRTAVPPGQAPAGTLRAGVAAGSTLTAIAACESGGDPTAVDASGTYRGKYQFDSGTWASVGGSGDPAAASEAEQDMRAAMLYARAGSAPWPVCGQ